MKMDRHTDKLRKLDKMVDRQTDRWTYTDGQIQVAKTDGWTDRDRCIDRQTNWQDIQADRLVE
jgi:hypothetical protein